MKQTNYLSFLLSLMVVAVMASCSSTQYAAHFAPSKYDAHAQKKKEQVHQNVLASQDEAPVEAVEEIAARSGAADVRSDAVPRAATLKNLITEAEMPDVNELTARQQKILAETRERLKNMTRQEKRELRRQVRNINLAEYTKNLPAYENMGIDASQQTASRLLVIITTIFIPPLGVFLHEGGITNRFWISLLLTLLLFVPGLIYSLIVVLGG